MTAYEWALILGGFCIGVPVGMAFVLHEIRRERQRRRWNAQRKEREQRMGGLYR